ncbi:cell wall-binding repeat-containing protein [Ornithinimicrobium faecis]|uniref:Cell wall-binding repeat-containing protein n=1 Tax=Ornithinimicrobium faecis TaxID=2934158 RepID=A0ABY4YYF5_9MICO|nr:cell wall-binding repeat-containing protein [Ornithinimicrobium sp. HY1793]USQ81378.1 cell wall-binding repeat-containing protein [Ornithinimicrobium sp. HY1793]
MRETRGAGLADTNGKDLEVTPMAGSRGLGRGLVAAAAGASLVATGIGALGAGAQDLSTPPATLGTPLPTQDRIDAEVTAELESDGSADFWIDLGAEADLSPAYEIEDWEERGQFVYDALTSTAQTSQADLRAELDEAGATYETFYVSNAIRVTDGDVELVASLSDRADVAHLHATFETAPPEVPFEPVSEADSAPAEGVEWNLQDVRADAVWSTGTSGEGIIVATIDTGAEWDHPGLINHYRGFNGGEVNHNYSWFDATGESPQQPADSNGHGTHVTGTLVGDDGGVNQVGMAPGARWIAANGCGKGCKDSNLLASGQWTLAPTNLAGENPNAALRPHVINNSWGSTSPSTGPLLEDVSKAWAAAGQFAVFSNGNLAQWGSNPCRSSSSPGSRIINYSVGNYTKNHTIASTSSRGTGQGGAIKPDISAPGTNVRSTWPGGGYATGNGTSMAAPHVAGAVALLWSARPDLRGDVDVTRALLDGSAIDTNDTSCGGTAANNNVFGEGRLNAAALINSAPATPVHRISGQDRYSTAAAIATGYQNGAGVVYLATGNDYPDALVGAALAGTKEAPVLLTKPDTMPAATVAQLKRLQPATVVLLGGQQVISQQVLGEVQQLLPNANTGRRAGDNRYETAAMISRDFKSSDVVYIATGADYPDGLAGAARSGALDAPVLLTQPGNLPNATKVELDRLRPQRIVLLGGPTAISKQVGSELQAYAPTTRVAGTNRYETAAQISTDYQSASTVYIATGTDWPDALAGAARAGRDHAPILLAQPDNVPNATVREVRRLNPDRIFVLGGPSAISTASEIELGRIE